MSHMFCVSVTCHMSLVACIFNKMPTKIGKGEELVNGGSVFNEAYPV